MGMHLDRVYCSIKVKVAEKEGKPQVPWFEDGTGWAKAMVEEFEAPR